MREPNFRPLRYISHGWYLFIVHVCRGGCVYNVVFVSLQVGDVQSAVSTFYQQWPNAFFCMLVAAWTRTLMNTCKSCNIFRTNSFDFVFLSVMHFILCDYSCVVPYFSYAAIHEKLKIKKTVNWCEIYNFAFKSACDQSLTNLWNSYDS